MTKSPVDRKTKSRRPDIRERVARTRIAQLPDNVMPNIVPFSLFTSDNLWRLSSDVAKQDRALRPRQQNDPELVRIALDLRHGFDWAVHCSKMWEWHAEPERRKRWYEQVARHADGLLKALAVSPEGYRDPTTELKPWSTPLSIHDFRQSLDRMAGARPDLPSQLDALSRVVWDEDGSRLEGDGLDAEGYCQYRRRASFLIDRLPRTVALVSALATSQLEDLKRRTRRPADKSDHFGRELFKFLAGVHGAIFECKPSTRNKTGEANGGSIAWARAVIHHAADAIEASPFPMPLRATGSTTHMQLQKLTYLAHGWSLGGGRGPLIEEMFEAWAFGPVVRKLYDSLKKYGSGNIERYIRWGDDTPLNGDAQVDNAFAQYNEIERDLLGYISATYGRFHADQLSGLTQP